MRSRRWIRIDHLRKRNIVEDEVRTVESDEPRFSPDPKIALLRLADCEDRASGTASICPPLVVCILGHGLGGGQSASQGAKANDRDRRRKPGAPPPGKDRLITEETRTFQSRPLQGAANYFWKGRSRTDQYGEVTLHRVTWLVNKLLQLLSHLFPHDLPIWFFFAQVKTWAIISQSFFAVSRPSGTANHSPGTRAYPTKPRIICSLRALTEMAYGMRVSSYKEKGGLALRDRSIAKSCHISSEARTVRVEPAYG